MSDKICVLDKDYLEIWKYFDKIDETNEIKYFHLYKLKSKISFWYILYIELYNTMYVYIVSELLY